MADRQAVESPLDQGEDEIIAYVLDTTNGAGSGAITSEVDIIKDEQGDDVSATNLTGATSVSGGNITTRGVTGLKRNIHYRMEVQWVQNGNTFEAYWTIEAKL